MDRPLVVLGVLVLLASASLIVSAAGYSSVEADRQITVDVVGDPDAYLGLVYDDAVAGDHETGSDLALTLAAGETRAFVAVTNQFHATIDTLSVEPVDDGGFDHVAVELTDTDDIPVGGVSTVSLTVDHPTDHVGTIDLAIAADGHGFSVDAIRSVEVTLATPGLPIPTTCLGEADFTVDDGETLTVQNQVFEDGLVVLGGDDVEIKLRNIDVDGDVCVEFSDASEFRLVNTDVEGTNDIDGSVTIVGGTDNEVKLRNNDIGGDLTVRLGTNSTFTETNNRIDGDEDVVVG